MPRSAPSLADDIAAEGRRLEDEVEGGAGEKEDDETIFFGMSPLAIARGRRFFPTKRSRLARKAST